ncbi:sodium-dependent transporter, partial [archaeon]|nr:sodium-dependent transporter [archaeon]
NLGGIQWYLLIALALVWIGVYFCVRNGVKSVGKVVLITMPLPIILLIILFFRGITLPGALEGILAYITPDFAALLDTEIWIAAVAQVFFSLSLAFGIMIAYASFNNKKQDIIGDSYITAISDLLIGLLAGFVVFSVLGYMATNLGVGAEEVVASGPGLAFVVFPEALSLMPFAWLFSIMFFLVLISLGIDSAFSLVEAVNTVISDRSKKLDKKKISKIVCSLGFIMGIIFTTGAGLYFLDLIDHFLTNFLLIGVGIAQSIAVGWFYGAEKLRSYINSVSKYNIGKWWTYSIKYVIPISLMVILIAQFVKDIRVPYESYTGWAIALGWAAVIVPVVIAVYYSLKK